MCRDDVRYVAGLRTVAGAAAGRNLPPLLDRSGRCTCSATHVHGCVRSRPTLRFISTAPPRKLIGTVWRLLASNLLIDVIEGVGCVNGWRRLSLR